ncbi:hypothetical protein GCM10027020_33690 [Nocardioides salsibiostraticola]
MNAGGTDVTDVFTEVVATHDRCFWLDGGGARGWSGSRSIIGWLEDDDVSLSFDAATSEVTRHQGGESMVVGTDVFAVLEAEMGAGRATDQWFGFFGYAARPDLPARPGPGPDAVWMRARHVRSFSHPAPDLTPMTAAAVPPAGAQEPSPAYAEAYRRVQEELHAGNSYEVNLTYRVQTESTLDPAAAYLRLRELNPAPYAGYLQHRLPDHPAASVTLLSSSPERYALIDEDGLIETKPIKGTLPRSTDAEIDAERRHTLATDQKFRAENLMIVDLLRNDLAMVCEPGTVEVPVLMEVESYATVHQLVSTVRGRLRPEVSTVGALRSLFPAGSMTGAPKLRTMQIIDEVEADPRGVYSGAFGWISGSGAADLGVVIRSAVVTDNGRYVVGTGGGITVLSDLDEEWAESALKAERLLAVFAGT